MDRLPAVGASRLGGDVAVDFLNTVGWRLDPQRRSEGLPDYAHLLAWARACDLLSAAEASDLLGLARRHTESARVEHAAAISLRDGMYAALGAGASPLALQERLPAALTRARLEPGGDGAWHWRQDLALTTPVDRLALEFARLLTSPEVARFHQCEDACCGWVFLDTSRQGNRRWCSAADCGNRNRVRAHYRRSKRGR